MSCSKSEDSGDDGDDEVGVGALSAVAGAVLGVGDGSGVRSRTLTVADGERGSESGGISCKAMNTTKRTTPKSKTKRTRRRTTLGLNLSMEYGEVE
ncbi:MAG: hypothetical protein QXS54_04840 [Candidatus Methanomethylicaceae archaeon]